MPILVDCDWGRKNKTVSDKYGVSGYPTLILVDPEGNKIENGSRTAAQLVEQINKTAAKYTKLPPYVESWDKGMEAAKKDDKPVILVFTDDGANSKITEKSLAGDKIAKMLDNFILIRHEVEKKCETCKKYRVTRGANLYVIDPAAENPAKKPLLKKSGKQSEKSLESALKSALKRFEKSRK